MGRERRERNECSQARASFVQYASSPLKQQFYDIVSLRLPCNILRAARLSAKQITGLPVPMCLLDAAHLARPRM